MTISRQAANVAQQTITPGLAKKWLETLNPNNRNLRKKKYQQYAAMMTRGQWMSDGDTYKFDIDGNLLDGQHRLKAIIESGHTVKNAIVIKNLPVATFKILDSGLNRTPGDALGNDVPARTHKAAAIRLLYVVEILEGDPRRSDQLQSVTRTDLSDYYADYSDDIDFCNKLGDRLYSGFKSGSRSAWIAFVRLAMHASPNHSEEFLEGVLTGANLAKSDARLALRNWLANDRHLPNAGAHLGMLIKAWNSWMTAAPRTTMLFREDEKFPALETRKTIAP